MKNRVSRDFDPSEWQWTDKNGNTCSIAELSRDDLMQVACFCMEALDRAEEQSFLQQKVFEGWRIGRLPEE